MPSRPCNTLQKKSEYRLVLPTDYISGRYRCQWIFTRLPPRTRVSRNHSPRGLAMKHRSYVYFTFKRFKNSLSLPLRRNRKHRTTFCLRKLNSLINLLLLVLIRIIQSFNIRMILVSDTAHESLGLISRCAPL